MDEAALRLRHVVDHVAGLGRPLHRRDVDLVGQVRQGGEKVHRLRAVEEDVLEVVVPAQVLDRVELALARPSDLPVVVARVVAHRRVRPQHEELGEARVLRPPLGVEARVQGVALGVEDELARQVGQLGARVLEVAGLRRLGVLGEGVVAPLAPGDLVDGPDADRVGRRRPDELPPAHPEPAAQLLDLLVLEGHDLPLSGSRVRGHVLAVRRRHDVDGGSFGWIRHVVLVLLSHSPSPGGNASARLGVQNETPPLKMILVRSFPLIKDISYTERDARPAPESQVRSGETESVHSTPSQQEIGCQCCRGGRPI